MNSASLLIWKAEDRFHHEEQLSQRLLTPNSLERLLQKDIDPIIFTVSLF